LVAIAGSRSGSDSESDMGYPRSDSDEESGKESESDGEVAETCGDLLAIFAMELRD